MEDQSTPPEPQPAKPLQNNPHTIGMLCHLLSLCGLLGVPFGNVLGPLVLWLVKRDEHEFIDDCGKEAVNFQISMTIYTIVSALLMFAFVGLILLPAVLILNIIYTIVASIQASDGVRYRYPFTIRFIN